MAVVAAIDLNGRLLGLKLAEKSIRYWEFLEFLDHTAIKMAPYRKAWMLVDNLKLHYNKDLRKHAAQHNIKFLFNPLSAGKFVLECLNCLNDEN